MWMVVTEAWYALQRVIRRMEHMRNKSEEKSRGRRH
jgi:hypothetical protein